MKSLTHYKEKIEAELSVANLFDQAPTIYFSPEDNSCGEDAKVLKTRKKSMW